MEKADVVEIKNGDQTYEVGKNVLKTDDYHLYLCTQKGTGRQCLFKIATAVDKNGILEREAYVLGVLKERSNDLEAKYALVKEDQKVLLNYDLGFPELVEAFVCAEQGGRVVNILAFKCVDSTDQMVPLKNITDKDKLRIDLRTSAWILGKLLKLLVFAHSSGIAIGLIDGWNILIEPMEHYVLIFDWSKAELFVEQIPTGTRCQEILQAAQAVIIALGGDIDNETLPDDGDPAYSQYAEYIWRLANGGEGDAEKAHKNFYAIVDLSWKREYYKFTTKPL